MSEAYDTGPFGVVRYGRDEMVQHEHRLADGADAVAPGELVERVDDDGDIRVQAHSEAGSADNCYVVIEARGRGMNAQDGEYDVDGDDLVRYVDASGGGLNMHLAAGEDVSIGDGLESDGAGQLVAQDTGDAVAEAAAAVDNSAGADAVFIPTEVN